MIDGSSLPAQPFRNEVDGASWKMVTISSEAAEQPVQAMHLRAGWAGDGRFRFPHFPEPKYNTKLALRCDNSVMTRLEARCGGQIVRLAGGELRQASISLRSTEK